MNYISLQLDTEARGMVSDLLDRLDEDNGWFKMTTRIAAQIDTKLVENRYVGNVLWFSEEDYIEQEIVYQQLD